MRTVLRASCVWVLLQTSSSARLDGSEQGLLSHKAMVVANRSAVEPLTLATLVLKYAWSMYSVIQNIQEVKQHISDEDGFAELSAAAVEQIDSLIHKMSQKEALHSRDAVQSQYLEMRLLRQSLAQIKSHCQPVEGLLHFPHAMIFGDVDESVAKNISNLVAGMEDVFEEISDGVFCVHFQRHILEEVRKLVEVIRKWEQSSGKMWYPRRKVRNTNLAGPDTEEHKQYLMDTFGLSESDFRRVQWMQIRHVKNGWIHHRTTLEDNLQQDIETDAEIKEAVAEGIRQVGLIFAEMTSVSRACKSSAEDLKCLFSGGRTAQGKSCKCKSAEWGSRLEAQLVEFQLCRRCPECCSIIEEDDIMHAISTAIQHHMEEHSDAVAHFWDSTSLIAVQFVFLIEKGFDILMKMSVSSVMWISARMLTGFRLQRPGLCRDSLALLQNHSSIQDNLGSDIVENLKSAAKVWDSSQPLSIPEIAGEPWLLSETSDGMDMLWDDGR
mmetsp:Transcript_58352/g.103719  ORF Transcript_58352/g.103719 Transcript_58352/m.103719 type:complete len:495 (+) Transcript_58352:80-1564(+)